MPFYDYRCVNDHEHKNLLRKYDEKIINCPTCGEVSHRQYTFRFNATGLPNGFIGNNRRTNIHDKRIDTRTLVTKNPEE